MEKKIVKTTMASLVVTGLIFAGQAGTINAEANETDSGKVTEKVEQKANAVQSKLVKMEESIVNVEELSDKKLYKYENQIGALLNRLGAADNQLNAQNSDDNGTAALIEAVRTDIHDTKEDIDSALADVPDNLDEAEDPTFEIGSEAIIEANHMEGMDGAEATITGAYDTIAYSVSFTPTTGGEPVKDHKWVIHEELAGVNEDSLEPGDKAVIEADHMEGMEGATATIESARNTTVYMIDFKPTDGGPKVENHKWVVESELSEK